MSQENWIRKAPPRNKDENDCEYWQRVYDSMPDDQKNSVSGFIAQIGTYKLVPQKFIMCEKDFEDFLEDCEIFRNLEKL